MADGCVLWFLFMWSYVFSKLIIIVNKLITPPALHSGSAGFWSRAGDRRSGREFLRFSLVSPGLSIQISLWLLNTSFCIRRSLLILTSDVMWYALLAAPTDKRSNQMKCFLSKSWRRTAGVTDVINIYSRWSWEVNIMTRSLDLRIMNPETHWIGVLGRRVV
jgi:hypothetical protein